MTQVVLDISQIEIDESSVDFSDIEAKFKVEIPTSFDTIVVLDGAPIVDSSKEKKLVDKIKSLFKNTGEILDVTMPMSEETGKSKGYLFLEFESSNIATAAVHAFDRYKFDKNHTFSVNKIDDISKYQSVPEEFVPPKPDEFIEKPQLGVHLQDSRARDQWVIMKGGPKGDDVAVYWNNKGEMPDLVESRLNWSDSYVSWSPRGTFLSTLHKQGVALWGGPKFDKIMRFSHANVKLIDFSPDERFLVTWSQDPITLPNGDLHHIIIWDILSGRSLRSFPSETSKMQITDPKQPSTATSTMKIEWPYFKWSHDSKFVARLSPGGEAAISVYETPGMGLIDKRSIKIENLKSFEWSPVENLIGYWTCEPEIGNTPTRVALMRIPSREVIRTKNLFNAKLLWQSNGRYMLVQVERSKAKKQAANSIEVFRIKEKDVPVDVIDLKANETAQKISWEPSGERFGVLTATGSKVFFNLYEMNSANSAGSKKNIESSGSIKLIKTVERKGINSIIWSPKGRLFVLAGVRGLQGDIEFWDADDMTLLSASDHYTCTDIEWDPSGRYVISSVSWWRIQTDPGFILWTSTGTQITKQSVPVFKQIVWRPRPQTPLSPAEIKAIRKNLKEYSKEFEEIDAKETNKISREVTERRRALWAEWVGFRRRCMEDYINEAPQRLEIVGYDMDEDNIEERELKEYIEEVIDEVEEILGDAPATE